MIKVRSTFRFTNNIIKQANAQRHICIHRYRGIYDIYYRSTEHQQGWTLLFPDGTNSISNYKEKANYEIRISSVIGAYLNKAWELSSSGQRDVNLKKFQQ